MAKTNEQVRRPRSEGQQFLIGESLYLRPVEYDDAKTAAIWRPSPFPAPQDVIEEQLKEADKDADDPINRDWLLIVCRKRDDRPVGSVHLHYGGWRYVDITTHLDGFLSQQTQVDIVSELAGILIPWHLGEQNLQVAYLIVPEALKAVEHQVADLGGHQCYRMRERLFKSGSREDEFCYEFLNPLWVERMGEPRPIVEGPVERSVLSPAPASWPAPDGDPPSGALMVGERLYLRAFDPEEGKLVSKWALQESEIYYSQGRIVFNPHRYGAFHKNLAKKDPPAWVRFAIVLRENNELIGANGLGDISWVHRSAETETEIFRPEHRSAGYGTEAKHLLLDYGFNRLGLHTVHSYVEEINERSAAALRKQGYRDCGYFTWEAMGPGGMKGCYVFDLLASEWRTARQNASAGSR